MSERLVADPFNPGAYRVVTGDTAQSWVDPADPERLEFEYVQRIAEVLSLTVLARPDAERVRVIHVGGGGLTLPRFVAARRPHTAQIVLEPDADLMAEVRRLLPLPRHSGIKVREVDGRSGIDAMPAAYTDAIVIDAFDGAQVPGELATREFFNEVRRVLRPGGLVVLNITDKGPFFWARRCVAGLGEVFRQLILSAEAPVLKGKRFGNLVVVGSAARLPLAEIEASARRAAFPYRCLSGRELDRWVVAALPFTDGAPVSSPGPPLGRGWFD